MRRDVLAKGEWDETWARHAREEKQTAVSASSTGFPNMLCRKKLPRPQSLAIDYFGESGTEGSDGKGREKKGKVASPSLPFPSLLSLPLFPK